MERLERLVVHVEEGVRLGMMPDQAHQRLGLVLLDSAAELMMYRESESLLAEAQWDDDWLRIAKARYEATGVGADWVTELQGNVVSNSQRKKIERDFNVKCDYLYSHGLLAGPQVRILKKLHKYRNETYHRDEVRSVTLASALKIYIYLVCSMMRDFPGDSISYSSSNPPSGLVKYLEGDERGSRFLRIINDLPARIASCLLSESGVAEPAQLGDALSQHVCDRLDELEEAAERCARFFRQPGRDEGWDLGAILGIVQMGWDLEEILKIAQMGSKARVRSSKAARALIVPVRTAHIKKWRKAGEALVKETDDMAAFAAFADLEDAFEPVETQVTDLAIEVGNEIDRQIDILRGK